MHRLDWEFDWRNWNCSNWKKNEFEYRYKSTVLEFFEFLKKKVSDPSIDSIVFLIKLSSKSVISSIEILLERIKLVN